MKHIVQKLCIIAVLVAGFVMVSAPAALAQTKADVCEGVAAAGASCNGATGTSVNSIITVIINTLSVIVGIVAVIMIILAGYKYITSGGDSSSVASAKNTLIYAIVGLIIVAMAQIIVQFVLSNVT